MCMLSNGRSLAFAGHVRGLCRKLGCCCQITLPCLGPCTRLPTQPIRERPLLFEETELGASLAPAGARGESAGGHDGGVERVGRQHLAHHSGMATLGPPDG